MTVVVSAHQIPPITSVYFRIEGQALQVLVRLPMMTLSEASFPLTARGTIDLAQADRVLSAAAMDFVRNMDLADGERSLPTPRVRWMVALPDDDSFGAFETAAAHLNGPALPAETEVGIADGFLDLQLDYALTAAPSGLSARFNVLRSGGQYIPTRVTYLPPGGRPRQFDVEGAPRRVDLEPGLGATARLFSRLVISRFSEERVLLLFLFCLTIQHGLASIVRLAGATLTGLVAAASLAIILPGGIDPSLQLACALIASLLMVLAALQAMSATRRSWVLVTCILFGLATGVGTGSAISDILGYAGSHALTGVMVFLGVLIAGGFAVALVGRLFVAWVARLPIPARYLPVFLALVPLHSALHIARGTSGLLAERVSTDHARLAELLAHWPPLVAVASLIVLVVIMRTFRPLEARYDARP